MYSWGSERYKTSRRLCQHLVAALLDTSYSDPMRPESLNTLFAAITSLPGLGPRLSKLAAGIAGEKVVDLLWHLPSGLIDRRYAPTLSEAVPGAIATLTVRVDSHTPPRTKRLPYRVTCTDGTGRITLVFFHAKDEYIGKILPIGEERVISGKLEAYNDGLQMAHPDHIVPVAERERIQTVEPVYPLTDGLSLRILARAMAAALERLPNLPEWQDPAFMRKNGFPVWPEALRAAHGPKTADDLSPATAARRRLAYDELLANQLALALVRENTRSLKGRALAADGRLRAKIEAALPYRLTVSQKHAIAEILGDMQQPFRMHRLLQGDVGSGKTVVALLAMMGAVEAGAQATLLAPTEILARQHFATIEPLARAAGVEVALLTGRDKGKGRDAILAGIAEGRIGIAIGTHALIETDVQFRDLAIAVIDEQHRFGVHQRLALGAKGRAVDVLVMTATPIPRTLTLTVYGDMEVSKLTEKPAGRQPIDTRTVALERLDEVVDALKRALASKARIYWVCPLVEESEILDVTAVEERHAHLTQLFGARVGMIHGRMKAADKDRVMVAFAEGSVDILVATTVIEVGVDVPQASVMVIEHAERFGLAQLHQLRGRIGRGSAKSTCLLLYAGNLSETARQRLAILRETDDGFRIAEEDLRLRGAGELLGTRQSGLPEFRLADLVQHTDLMDAARDDTQLILSRDKDLVSERGQALRVLLYLFERDAAVRLLRAG